MRLRLTSDRVSLARGRAEFAARERHGTGRGVRERRQGAGNKWRLTGAPTRRLKVSIPRFFSREGAPVLVPEGWGRRPPGRTGPYSRPA